MNVDSVAHNRVTANKINLKQRPQVNFKGGLNSVADTATDVITKSMKSIEKGGFFAEFLAIDFFGMILPRVFQALNRNKEELGHLNYDAATEEFLREILTGPGMLLIPLTVLATSGKTIGNSAKISRNVICEMEDVTKNACKRFTKEGNKKELNRIFYEELFNKCTKDVEASPVNAKKAQKQFVEKLIKLEEECSQNNGFLKNVANRYKNVVKKLSGQEIPVDRTKVLKGELTGLLTNYRQQHGLVQSSTEMKISKEVTRGVGDLIDDAVNFASDSIKRVKQSISSENIESVVSKVVKRADNSRKFVTGTAFAGIVAFLYIVPKIYIRNKEYPGSAGLENKGAKSNQKINLNELPLASARAMEFLRKMSGGQK